MAEIGGSLRVQVFGADPAHAEREARQLREVLGKIDGVRATFEKRERGAEQQDGAKGAILTPEVVLLVGGGTFTLIRAAIKAWVEVRKSRYARVEFSDGTVSELRGSVSGRELKEIHEQRQSRPEVGP